jgi:hypothetical protein
METRTRAEEVDSGRKRRNWLWVTLPGDGTAETARAGIPKAGRQHGHVLYVGRSTELRVTRGEREE